MREAFIGVVATLGVVVAVATETTAMSSPHSPSKQSIDDADSVDAKETLSAQLDASAFSFESVTPRATPTAQSLSVSRVKTQYSDVLHWGLLPVPTFEYDRLAGLAFLTAVIQTAPAYKKYVTRPRLGTRFNDEFDVNIRRVTKVLFPEKAFLWHGAYPCPNVSNQARHYVLPRHADQEPHVITDQDERTDWLTTYGSLACDLAQVAPHFGLTQDSLQFYCHRQHVGYGEQKRAGRARVGRTFETMQYWGYTYREIAAAFGISTGTVARYVKTGREDMPEFTPPEPPTES